MIREGMASVVPNPWRASDPAPVIIIVEPHRECLVCLLAGGRAIAWSGPDSEVAATESPWHPDGHARRRQLPSGAQLALLPLRHVGLVMRPWPGGG
jgi:hypothetical protein